MNPFSPENHMREFLTEEIMAMTPLPDRPIKNRDVLAKATITELMELRYAMVSELLNYQEKETT